MNFGRRRGLTSALVCLWYLHQQVSIAQQPAPPAPKPKEDQAKPSTQPPKPQNPFEVVPEAKEEPAAPKPQAPKMEAPKQAVEPAKPAGEIIEAIEFRGARRVPQDTLRQQIFSKKGDRFDRETLQRDFMALWNTGRFDDITLETEQGTAGVVVRFLVVERRVVRSIKYPGVKSVTVSEILDRFKERKVGLSVESQYDPARVQRAAVVLKEFLSERGRQFAVVDPEVRQIPPSSLSINFNVVEGPKVKVGHIDITGNQVFSDREAIRAMKLLRPIGIPKSILFENLFAKAYDSNKLEADKEFLREAYRERGYFLAKVLDHDVKIRDVGGGKFRVPLVYMNKPGKRADITIPVEEGQQYKLNKINFVGVKLFRTPDALMRPLFQMDTGDVFSTGKLRKGFEELRKLYGQFGYIDAVTEPTFDFPGGDKIDLTLTADEGKQFFVRRIDFSGNTTTRDKVIRREVLIDEGDVFNSRLWELSILRLNQLGYFEVLKENESADIQRNTQSNTVDITLRVKERGKNSIGLTGGVSGIAGSFMGFNYATNNFLGLGETLSIDSQLGARLRDVSFGFTEPYFMDRPLQLGFVIYMRRFDFDQGREVSLLTGRNYIPLFNELGAGNLLNYVQNSRGFNVSASYPLRRSFARIGLTYGYDTSDVIPDQNSTAAKQYFDYINFQGIGGPNQLEGIRTSRIVPSYSYNTVNHPINPTGGRSLFISTEFAGSFMGGNVNLIRPVVDAKYFKQVNKRGHVLAFHGMTSLMTGYGGKSAPPFNRSYIGGEQDIRGFDIWGISPIAYVASEGSVPVLNSDGSTRRQKVIDENGQELLVDVTQNIPIYQMVFPGGDMQAIGNFEYRIPIVGPVNLALFTDIGVNKIFRPSQLRMNPDRVNELNGKYPQAGFNGQAIIAPGTQKPRMSTGIELQVLLPVVNAPFRVYWAYNPLIYQDFLQPPIVADRSFFPNNATFLNSIATIGRATPFFERRRSFRFTIGRTF